MVLPLSRAVAEEVERRIASFESVKRLHEFFVEIFKGKGLGDHFYENAIDILSADVTSQQGFDKYYKENFPTGHFPLRFNKNTLLFDETKKFLSSGVDLLSDNLFEDLKLDQYAVNKIESDNANGTSLLNILQIALIASIRTVIDISDIHQLNELLGGEHYDPMVSPVVQGVPLPDARFNSSSYFYYDQQENELIAPNLGYTFGGSRGHERYKNKDFKAEDCSSAIAKWVGAPGTFATYAMKLAHAGDCKGDDLCANVQAVLSPKSPTEGRVEGMFLSKDLIQDLSLLF